MIPLDGKRSDSKSLNWAEKIHPPNFFFLEGGGGERMRDILCDLDGQLQVMTSLIHENSIS